MVELAGFLSFGISKQITERLQQDGITIATPVQEKTIPLVLDGADVMAQAQTGTGKTLAFILPILEKINHKAPFIQALIVTPTRELALQISEKLEKLMSVLDETNVLAIYGGQDVERQLKKLKKNPAIVVGTPGRILDHIRRGTLNLSETAYLVLDEADQMLHIGFLDEVEKIIKETPSKRQTLLFSATMPPEIQQLAVRYMREPRLIRIDKKQVPAENVKLIGIQTIDRAKQSTLIELVDTYRPFLAVIFCRTKRRVTKLYEILRAKGFSCDELHGDLSQAKRELVMKRFRDAEFQLLIATDVAARGLDVEGVTHVINYDIPQDSESFIHRIGRTGRAGLKGIAITLYTSKDRSTLDFIEKDLNIKIQKQSLESKNSIGEKKNTKTEMTITEKSSKQSKRGNKQNGKHPHINSGGKKSLDRFGRSENPDKGKRTASAKPVGKTGRGGKTKFVSKKKSR